MPIKIQLPGDPVLRDIGGVFVQRAGAALVTESVSVSAANATLTAGTIKKHGKLVVLPSLQITLTAITPTQAYNTTELATLPAGFSPQANISRQITGSAAGTYGVAITPEGKINITFIVPGTAEGKTIDINYPNIGWETA